MPERNALGGSNELQHRNLHAVGKEPTARGPRNGGVDEQSVFVDDAAGDKSVRQADAAGEHDVHAGLGLQRPGRAPPDRR